MKKPSAILSLWLPFILISIGWSARLWAQSETSGASLSVEPASVAQNESLNFQRLFAQSHDGWSLDEVLIRDELRAALMNAYRAAGGQLSESVVLEELLSLRKRGKLAVPTTRSDTTSSEQVEPAAEIAARRIIEDSKVSLDRIFVDPDLLKRFDQLAQQIVPDGSSYLIRKAALRLRKTRQLRPELLSRVTDWKLEIITLDAAALSMNINIVPKRPGVYIFRDSTGYLYIGQSKDLRDRLAKHFKESDRVALFDYLKKQQLTTGDLHGPNAPKSSEATIHVQSATNAEKEITSSELEGNTTAPSRSISTTPVLDREVMVELHVFQEGSPGEQTTIREAYESELIRTREPRFNVAP